VNNQVLNAGLKEINVKVPFFFKNIGSFYSFLGRINSTHSVLTIIKLKSSVMISEGKLLFILAAIIAVASAKGWWETGIVHTLTNHE
jgi:hypothetical protein